MFLLLSKTLDWLLSPLSWTLLLVGLALLLGRRRRPARVCLGLALATLLGFSSGPVANGLAGWAESQASTTLRPEVVYDAVIILGGAFDPDASAASGSLEFNAAAERLQRGFDLLRGGQAQNALLSAGATRPVPGVPPEALVLKRQLESWGIDPARLFPESSSRNTYENAVESARIVRAQGWKSLVLVTSAAHLPRALACFQAQGLAPDTLPVDFRHSLRDPGLAPRSAHLAASSEVLRELFGRLVYRLVGYYSPPPPPLSSTP